ncbi:MAG: glycosyltransferase family 10 domain-containing protein [Sphingobacteriaceae bacterium]
MPRKIKIKFINGIDAETAKKDILNELLEQIEFIESDHPDFILFGPYGNDIPPQGNYIRIGYFCENMLPDLSICEWAFGIPEEREINSEKYKRIQWHGIEPTALIKPPDYDVEKIIKSKKHFCNFFYSHSVPYREAFFKQLSKYKKVDAPGKSMNNMPGIDHLYSGNRWEIKRQFLSDYKFTIAFENDIYPGYQTEKLYDAMQANSLPVYCGDPHIQKIFNTKSFLNLSDYSVEQNSSALKWLETNCQMDFEDIRPAFLHSPKQRFKRFIKRKGREHKTNRMFSRQDFSNLIDRVIELDKNPDLYAQYLRQPWLNNNAPSPDASSKSHWIKIFNSAKPKMDT